jgi:deoxyribodipyrimidine photo-lyase
VNPKRVQKLNDHKEQKGPVVYWMSRDQRTRDNWALLHAQQLAIERKVSLAIVFCLVPNFLGATIRHYGFMLKGLEEVEESCAKKSIPFFLLQGDPAAEIPAFVQQYDVGALVTDFDPLRIKRKWKEKVAKQIKIPFHEVDTHNIVPCRVASNKLEYAAYTIRPKIHRALFEYLDEIPALRKHPVTWKKNMKRTNWEKIRNDLKVDATVPEISWIKPGERAAKKALKHFVEQKLKTYDESRNDPTLDGQSNLSPYLHFGQLSPQRVALAAEAADVPHACKEAFLEELIVRRELSDNYCYYNRDYDTLNGIPNWAAQTLKEHKQDKRNYHYSREEFERAETHDDLWNAAQMEMVVRGKMHGYMRMYWAKKILEWTESPEEAVEMAVYLNDKYELDGRDPNGYVGIMWSVAGVHDRAWPARPVFGKIRYMSYNGCKSKFDVKGYIEKVKGMET